ncbi:MAG: hypothetical protein HUU38_14905 [Anaerolineales bacterium]|nr:hypothetical protein [Anaerolineales bacterium]
MEIFLMLFMLTGCTAQITAPVTMPIWIFIGYAYLVGEKDKQEWKDFSNFCRIQIFILIVFWLLLYEQTFPLKWVIPLALISFPSSVLAINLLGNENNSEQNRLLGYILQVISAILILISFGIIILKA